MPELFFDFSWVNSLVWMFLLLIVLGAVGILAYLGYSGRIKIPQIMKFPIEVIIFVQRGNAVVVERDRATRIIDPATKREVYFLKNAKREIQAFKFANILPGNLLLLFSPAAGEYHPCTFFEQKREIMDEETGKTYEIHSLGIAPVIDETAKVLYAQTARETVARFSKQNWIERYMPIIVFALAVIGVVLLFYVNNAVALAGVQAASGIAEKLDKVADKLTYCPAEAQVRQTQPTATPPPW